MDAEEKFFLASLAAIILAILIVVGFVGYLLVSEHERELAFREKGAASQIDSSTSTTSSPQIAVSSTSTTTTLTENLSSTTIPTIPSTGNMLLLNISPENIYREDKLKLTVTDDLGNPVQDTWIFLYGNFQGETDARGVYYTSPVKTGDHILKANKTGFSSAEYNFSVPKARYGLSMEVRRLLSDGERREAINQGRVSIRFYDSPNCPNCLKMKPVVADLIGPNRDCILYELVNLWNYQEELKGKFPRMTTPIIEVEGNRRMFQYQGLVSKKKLAEKIEQNMGGDCEFQWN